MQAVHAAFPRRPLTLRSPHGVLGAIAWALGGALFGLAILGWLAASIVPQIQSDFAIRDSAVPLANARVLDGKCRSQLGLLHTCEATLVVPLKSGEVRRKVEATFAAPHLGDWSVRVMADPQRPELATTDIALDRLWNRVATAGGGVLFALAMALGGLVIARGRLRTRDQARALSGQALTPVPLAFHGSQRGTWSLSDQQGRQFQIEVPAKARPFVLDPARGIVLGVTAPGAAHPIPLDDRLRWIGLTDQERAALIQARG